MTNGTPNGLRMVARGQKGQIDIYGIIGGDGFFEDGITAEEFSKELKALSSAKEIDVHINSDGGDAFQGRTIYSLLASHPARISVHVDGIAASAASLIAMAGDEIIMADGSFMMIHEAWGAVRGRASDLRKRADTMDQVNETMAQTYAKRSGQPYKKVRQMMDEETWMEASVAKSLGFADTLSDPLQVAACVEHPGMFKNLPNQLRPKAAAAMRLIDGMKNPAPRR